MAHCRRDTRPFRDNTQESHQARRQHRGLDQYDGGHPATYDESSFEDTTHDFIDNPQPEFRDTRIGNILALPRAEDGFSSISTMPNLTMVPVDGTFDYDHSHQL